MGDKMKKNLVQKFRKFYFALPKEEQIALYDIISAIRGEDNGSFTLKTYTTARIRGALFGKSQIDFAKKGLVFASFKKAQAYDRRSRTRAEGTVRGKWRNADEHFRDHVKSAIIALRKHGFKRAISDLMEFTRSTNLSIHK